jgi:hypothetical protein
MEQKPNYFIQLTTEASTIELDYTNLDRWGHHVFDEDEETPVQLIRASKYSSVLRDGANSYEVFIKDLAQKANAELTFAPSEVHERAVKMLEQSDERIDEAWKVFLEHWDKWAQRRFSSFGFELKYFHFFNIQRTRTVGAYEEADFEKGKTTDNFFWDLHDAMMYKQEAVKWLLWQLKPQEQDEEPDTTDEQPTQPQEQEDEPGQPQQSGKEPARLKINQHVFALLCHYLEDETVADLAKELDAKLSKKQYQLIGYYILSIHRKGAGPGFNGVSQEQRDKNFQLVMDILRDRGIKDALERAQNDYSEFLSNCLKDVE